MGFVLHAARARKVQRSPVMAACPGFSTLELVPSPRKAPHPRSLGTGQADVKTGAFHYSSEDGLRAATTPKVPQVAVACHPRFR